MKLLNRYRPGLLVIMTVASIFVVGFSIGDLKGNVPSAEDNCLLHCQAGSQEGHVLHLLPDSLTANGNRSAAACVCYRPGTYNPQ